MEPQTFWRKWNRSPTSSTSAATHWCRTAVRCLAGFYWEGWDAILR
jgi:hypothetical protein